MLLTYVSKLIKCSAQVKNMVFHHLFAWSPLDLALFFLHFHETIKLAPTLSDFLELYISKPRASGWGDRQTAQQHTGTIGLNWRLDATSRPCYLSFNCHCNAIQRPDLYILNKREFFQGGNVEHRSPKPTFDFTPLLITALSQKMMRWGALDGKVTSRQELPGPAGGPRPTNGSSRKGQKEAYGSRGCNFTATWFLLLDVGKQKKKGQLQCH